MKKLGADAGLEELAASVYFIQGALGLAGIAFPIFLRRQGLGIQEIGLLSSIAASPWLLKLFYGALSDAVPLAGYRRKSYMMVASLISAAAWLALALTPYSFAAVAALGFISNLGFAFTDVAIDGLIVERSDEAHVKRYQSVAWGARSVGALVTGFSGGWLAAQVPARGVFALTGLLPLVTVWQAARYPERKSTVRIARSHLWRQCMEPFWKSLKILVQTDLKWFALLLFLLTFTASVSTPLFFYLKERLAFGETFLGMLSTLGWAGAVAGCWLFTAASQKMSLFRLLRVAVGLTVLNSLISLLISNRINATFIAAAGGVFYYLAYLPVLSVAARMAHHTGVESSLFALLMSLHNLGVIAASGVGGYLAEAIGLAPLIIASSVIAAAGFWVLPKLKGACG